MSDVFISYAREDKDFAEKFANALERSAFTVWWDRDIGAGEAFDKVIEQEIINAHVIVVIWSPDSRESEFVRTEAAEALSRSKLLTISIGQALPPFQFKLLHAPDFSKWNGSENTEPFVRLREQIRMRIQARPDGYVPQLPPVPPKKAFYWSTVATAALVVAFVMVVAWGLWPKSREQEGMQQAQPSEQGACTWKKVPYTDYNKAPPVTSERWVCLR